MKHLYTIESETIETPPGTGNHLRCSVLADGVKIGEYLRNYSTLFNTFFPFHIGDRDFALYSLDYTATRLISLPDCTDLGGEERDADGFCPTDFYVPSFVRVEWPPATPDEKVYHSEMEDPAEEQIAAIKERRQVSVGPLTFRPFGFVAGCIWGDDSSWKIQYLDLSEADKGILKREERFGYIQLPDSMTLKQAISAQYGQVKIATQAFYNLKTGKMEDPEDAENED